MSSTVAVFTSSRADAGPLSQVVSALNAEAEAELVVIATGAHLDQRRGRTLDHLPALTTGSLEVVEVDFGEDEPSNLIAAFGPLATGVAEILRRRSVDILVVLGDRWELLPVAGAALLLQVPIAHLHGGEVTEGAIDDRIRHALTKLADLHLCATEDSAGRIRQMGEEAWRVVKTGAPALDRFAGVLPETPDVLAARIGVPLEAPWGIVTYHPPTVDRSLVRERARAVIEAAAGMLGAVVVTYPGSDPGAGAVIEEIERMAAELPNVHAVPNLGDDYPVALASADVMVGNSSSGVIEAASFRLPVVNVGDRQRGRLMPENVVQCEEEDPASIGAAIARALDPVFKAGLDGLVNPYGDGQAASRVIRALLEAPYDRLARKRFVEMGRP